MKILDLFKRKKMVTIAIPPSRSSLFSTEVNGDQLTPDVFDDLLKRSFQRLPTDFKAVDAQGNEATHVPKISIAAPGLQQFAMDSPSEGNPLSMANSLPSPHIPYAQLAWYASQSFVGYQICAMLAQHWFIDKILSTPALDAMRNWCELATEDEEEIDPKVMSFIRKRDKAFGIKQNCIEFLRFNRMFGIRIALPIIEGVGPNYYLLPFDIKKVKPNSYKGMAQIDPYWITPELDFDAAANPASLHFYEPTWWRVNGQRIHRSHLVIIRNGQVADILKPTYYYGGIPTPQKMAERVFAAERTANEAPQLAMTKRTTFMNVDITMALANLKEFLQKMNFFTQMRDNFGTKIGGLEDKFAQFDTSLADFDELTMTQYTIACAAGDCPTSKIMGTTPKGGLGSEGTYDAGSYQQFLESEQSNRAEPLLERHHLLLMQSEVRPKFPEVPEDWQPSIVWRPVDTPSAKEQAEINEVKSRTGNNLTNGGAIDGVDERSRVANDKTSGYTGLGDREPEPLPDDVTGEGDQTGGIKSDKSEAGEK